MVKDPTSIPAIAKRLLATRQALGLSQVEVSRKIKISPRAWNNYELGRRRPELDTALLMRKQLGISLDFIYAGEEVKTSSDLKRRIDLHLRDNRRGL